MREKLSGLGTVLAVALALGLATIGCGSSMPGGHGGAGGSAGNGGVIGAGGTVAGGGNTGTGGVGSGGFEGTGGRATGGAGAGGAGAGGMGGVGSGGFEGTGGRASGGAGAGGAGGTGSGGAGGSGGRTTGGAGGGGAGGIGSGGRATGGTGAGGVTSLDAGCTGAACAIDAGQSDAPLLTCGQITTESACDLRGDCHSVFRDAPGCGCDGGACCVQFYSCADGGKANCTGPAVCEMMTPSCPAPYVVAYTTNCYEGCVRQSECPTPTCPAAAPANATACGPVDYSCFYEDCAGAGRTLATCTGGKWTVQTAACTSFACQGGITPGGPSCAPGQVCVLTTTSGGAYMVTPACVQHNCGTGPMSTQCIPSLYGSCSASYGLGGVVVQCYYSTCGSGQGGCA